MSTDAPQLPTFLTEPLACPPGRCQYPGRPLPPIFTQLETFLRQTFLDRLGDVIYVNGINSASEHLDAIDSTILCLAKRRSPEEVALEIEVKCEELKKLEIGEEGLAEYSSGNERRFRTLLASFVEDAVTAFDDCVRKFNPTSQHCLHSFLDPHFLPVWNVFDATRRVVRAGWKGKVDVSPRALLDELLAAIAEGSIEQSLWSEVDAWEREITRVRSKYLKTITSYFARKMEAAFRREGYHAIIERRGSIIGILSHFLRCNDSPPISYISFRAYADGSPQLAQFFRLLQSPAAIRYPVLSSPHAKANQPFVSSPSQVTASTFSAIQYVTSSAPRQSPPAFDQFEQLDTTAVDIPHLHRLVPPRFCPPNRCSKVQPDRANYPLLDKLVVDLFKLFTQSTSLEAVTRCIEEVRLGGLEKLVSRLSTLDCDTPGEKTRAVDLAKAALQDYAGSFDAGFVYALQLALGQMCEVFRTWNQENLGRTGSPCYCDLSHLTLELARRCSEARDDHAERIDNRRHAFFPPIDISGLVSYVERGIVAGTLSGECWRGEWRKKLATLLKVLNTPLDDYIIKNHHIFTPATSRLSIVFSSARIVEEIGSFPADWTFDVNAALAPRFKFLGSSIRQTLQSSECYKLQGDHALYASLRVKLKGYPTFSPLIRLQSTTPPIGFYELATLMDPSNFGARLNSAAMRLRIPDNAEDDDEDRDATVEPFQWSQIIYDCSAALYYGPPSFQAYYRRGYALTRLKMWKTAILDFKQALLIEPNDPLLKYCLSAAKRRTPL